MHLISRYALLSASLLAGSSAFASPINPITFSAGAVSPITLSPSSDTFSLNSSSSSIAAPGTVTLQTGSFTAGNSSIANQVINFSFSDVVTLNGITNTITIFGQDNVTTTSDVLTILAANPVRFGSYSLTINSGTFTATSVGQAVPVNLTATISPVPEPPSVALTGTGAGIALLSSAVLVRRACGA